MKNDESRSFDSAEERFAPYEQEGMATFLRAPTGREGFSLAGFQGFHPGLLSWPPSGRQNIRMLK
jgi:hypothetical protein